MRMGGRLVVSSVLFVLAGCSTTGPVLWANVETHSIPAVMTITDDGWFSMDVPVCAGDVDVSVGIYGSLPGHIHGTIDHRLDGPAPESMVVTFDVNPSTIAARSLTDQLPVVSDTVSYDPKPTALDEVGTFWVLTPRGYLSYDFAHLTTGLGWKPGERWTGLPTGDPKIEDFRPYKSGDDEMIVGYCANALASESSP